MKLENQIALVTAAAGAGIGFATARALAAEGADVVITDIHEARGLAAASALGDEFDREFLALPLDVADEAEVEQTITTIHDRKGHIDIIVNNAGRNLPAPLWEMSTAAWRQIIDVCLTSQFFILRAALPRMIERQRGAIINVSSGAAWTAHDTGDAAYSAAKAGVLGLTRALAAEVGRHGIRVNAVAPDLIWNEHLARIYPPDYFDNLRARSVTDREGRPEDIARVILFLATDDYLTGQAINASGGFYMHP